MLKRQDAKDTSSYSNAIRPNIFGKFKDLLMATAKSPAMLFYYSARPQIAIREPRSGAAERAIDLDGFFGLHPALDSLKPIYDEGHLAIVHAVGSPSN